MYNLLHKQKGDNVNEKSEMYEKEIQELNKQLYNSYKRIRELNDKDKKGKIMLERITIRIINILVKRNYNVLHLKILY